MNDEREFRNLALRELRHFKWLAVATFAVFLLCGAAFVTGAILIGVAVYQEENTFAKTAEALFDSGKFDQLQTVATARLIHYPIDVHAFYYKAKVHFHDKQWAEALALFEQTKRLEPAWSDIVQPYLDQARERIADGQDAAMPNPVDH